MIRIKLYIDGKERVYTARGVNLLMSYTAYELLREYELAGGNYPQDLLEKCEDFVCQCFGGSFSREQLLSGYPGSAFVLYPSIMNAVVAYSNEEIVNFPEPAKKAPEKATT